MNDVALFVAAAPGRIRGAVDTSATARGLFATDASNYRHVPAVVVTPLDVDDLVAVIALCREHDLAVTLRGGGTSIAGNATGSGVVIDTSRHLHRILAIDPVARTATVDPGVVLDRINEAAAGLGLTVGPDPSTHARCTIGGMIANNACGAHSMSSGRTDDCVRSLDVLLYDGTRFRVSRGDPAGAGAGAAVVARVHALATEHAQLLRTAFPQFPRRVSGYALDALLPERGFDLVRALVGTEGTLVTVLEATIDLVPLPAAKALVVAGFVDDLAAADAVPALLELHPAAVEGIDRELVDAFIRAQTNAVAPPELPPGQGWLLVETVGPDADQARIRADEIIGALTESAGHLGAVVHTESAAQRAMWAIREKGAGLATRLPDGSEAWPGWEDAAVPPANLGAYLRDFRALQERTGIRGVTYGHFGDGCIHTRLAFDLSSTEGVRNFRSFIEEAADIVVRHGGSLSGEHGDGQARSELLGKMYPPEVIALFAEFKAIFDPLGRMNPGIVVHPRPIDTDLRVGPRSRSDDRKVRPLSAGNVSEGRRRSRPAGLAFAYEADHGDFERAVRRCVGVGACRNERGGVMCPSYRVTHDEVHSTRGRAHLLHEMIEGDVITDGWRSTEVRDALDLCLGCKGCKSDCPVGVDVAAYKSEFLHQHYRNRLRPASHYSMGNLPLFACLASHAPRFTNALLDRPVIAAAARKLGGIHPRRSIPRFADETFTRWFGKRTFRSGTDGPNVVLWPDTFTNHFTPSVGQAAVAVLESVGVNVALPEKPVCCGLTWISTGQLSMARRVLLRTLTTMSGFVGDDSFVVGLEPSCVSALRSDLPELLPDHPVAAWLSTHVLTFAEALERFAPSDWGPHIEGSALVQTHCHQHATLGTAADQALMRRVGIDASTLDAGCCGMAGNFGFERSHYDTSIAVGELGVLPAVRAADADTAILADGFSCRIQIEQATDRRAVHLAELIAASLAPGSVRRR